MRAGGTKRGRWRLTRLAISLTVVASVWACGPVYIPVPPPMQTTFTLDETLSDVGGTARQFWIAAGGPDSRASNARYNIFDQNQNAGVIAAAGADGSYVAPPMQGALQDHVLIYYRDARGKDSAVACVLLSPARPVAETCP